MKMLKCLHLFAGILFIGSAQAAAPVAVWNGDLKDGSTNGDYTLSLNGNSEENGIVTITGDKGIRFYNNLKTNTRRVSVIVKYENLTATANNQVLVTFGGGNDSADVGSNADSIGLYARANNLNANAIWSGNVWNQDTGKTKGAFASEGQFALTYDYDANRTKGYMNGEVVYETDGLRGNSIYTHYVGVGGKYNSTNNIGPANNLKISAVAIFDGELSKSELAAFDFDFPTRMFSDKLAGSGATVNPDTYGDIVVPGYGYKATAFAQQTTINATTGSPSGLFAHPSWGYIQPHTIGMWVKVDALPASGEKDIYGFSTDGGTNNGYKLVATAEGKLKIGKKNPDGTWNGSNYYTTIHQITAGEWFYLTVSFDRDTSITGSSSPVAIRIYVNGSQVFAQDNGFSADLGGNNFSAFYVGAGVAVAGIYGDSSVISDAATIKSWATNSNLVEAVPPVCTKTISAPTNWSDIVWEGTESVDAQYEVTFENGASLNIDKNIECKGIVLNGAVVVSAKDYAFPAIDASGASSLTVNEGTIEFADMAENCHLNIAEGATLKLNLSADKHINGVEGEGTLIKDGGNVILYVHNTVTGGFAVDGTTIQINKGNLQLYATGGSDDTKSRNATFILGSDSTTALSQYGWYHFYGTIVFDCATEKTILGANVRTHAVDGVCKLVKRGAGKVKFNSSRDVGGSTIAGFQSLVVEAGQIEFANMNVLSTDVLALDFSALDKTATPIFGNFVFNSNYTFKFPVDWAAGEPFQLCSGTLSGIPVGGKIESYTFYLGDAETTATFNLSPNGSVFYNTGVKQIMPEGDYAISTLNGETIAVGQTVELTMKSGSTLTIDAVAKVATSVLCAGNLYIIGADGAEPTAAQLTALNFDKVTGNIKHKWYKYSGSKVIAVNFNRKGLNNDDGGGSDDNIMSANEDSGALDCDILGKGWLQVDARSSDWTSDAFVYDTTTDTELPADALQVKWSSNNNYMWTSATCKFLRGYLDDGGNHAQFSAKGIPFEGYSVIIYFATDTADKKFSPVTVNGATYTWSDGETVIGTTTWGACHSNVPEYGTNALCIKKQSGDLTVVGGANADGARGGIAAIVIVETNAATQRDVPCGTAYNISNAKTYTEDIVNLVFDDAGGVLTIDEEPQRVFNIVSKGMVTVAFSNGISFSSAIMSKLISRAEGGIRFVITDGTIPDSAPAAGVIYRWEGDMTLPAIPYVGSAYNGIVDIACEVAGSEGSVYVTGNKSMIFSDGASYETPSFVLGNQGGVTQNYTQNGGALEFTKGGSGTSTSSAFVLAHWNSTVTYDLIGGTIIVPNDNTVLGWDGKAILTIGGGTTTALLKTKGIANNAGHNGNDNVLTISPNGTLSLGEYGAGLQSRTQVKLNGGTLEAYETCTFAAANANGIQVTADSTINVPANVELTINAAMSGDGVVTKTGDGVLALGTTARPKLGVVSGKLRIIVSAAEIVTGTIELNTDQASYSDGVFELVDEFGEVITINSTKVNDGVLTINFKNNLVDATSKVSEWEEMEGAVVIKPRVDGEEIVITVDEAFADTITMLNVFGKVRFDFKSEASASAVWICPQDGSEVSISGPIPENVLIMPVSDSVLTIEENTTLAGSIVPESGAEIVIAGDLTLNQLMSMQNGSILTVNPGVTLTFGIDRPFSQSTGNGRSVGIYNVYGTIDIGVHEWLYESNSGACTFNFFAGSTIKGTTGVFNRGGGSATSYNLKAFESAENNYVSFNVARANSYDSTNITLNIEDGVGFKLLKSSPNKNILSGSNIAGVEIGENVGTVEIAGANTTIGDIVIGAGSTLGGSNSCTISGTLTGAGTITLPLRLSNTTTIDTRSGALSIPSITFGDSLTVIGEPGAGVVKGLGSKPTLPTTIKVLDPTTLTPSEYNFELVYDSGMLTLQCMDIFFDLPIIEHATVSIVGEGSKIVDNRAVVPYEADATVIYTADEKYSFKGGEDEKYTGQTVISIDVYADMSSDPKRIEKELAGVSAQTIVAQIRKGDDIVSYFDFMEAFNLLEGNDELILYADAILTLTDPYEVLANTVITLKGFKLSGSEAVSFLIDGGIAFYLYEQYVFDPADEGTVNDNITFTLTDGIIYSYAPLKISSDSYIKIYSEINGYTYAPSTKLETITASLRAGETVELPDGSKPKLIEALETFGYDLEKVSTMSVGEYKVIISPDEAVNGSKIESFEIAGGKATITIPAKSNLYYGLEYANNPAFSGSQVKWAEQGAKTLSAEAEGANMFYRVVITDKDPNIK